jgi:hypothetical protein
LTKFTFGEETVVKYDNEGLRERRRLIRMWRIHSVEVTGSDRPPGVIVRTIDLDRPSPFSNLSGIVFNFKKVIWPDRIG